MTRLMFHFSEPRFEYLQLLLLPLHFASEKSRGATGRMAGAER
jgi:hypothetical protein